MTSSELEALAIESLHTKLLVDDGVNGVDDKLFSDISRPIHSEEIEGKRYFECESGFDERFEKKYNAGGKFVSANDLNGILKLANQDAKDKVTGVCRNKYSEFFNPLNTWSEKNKYTYQDGCILRNNNARVALGLSGSVWSGGYHYCKDTPGFSRYSSYSAGLPTSDLDYITIENDTPASLPTSMSTTVVLAASFTAQFSGFIVSTSFFNSLGIIGMQTSNSSSRQKGLFVSDYTVQNCHFRAFITTSQDDETGVDLIRLNQISNGAIAPGQSESGVKVFTEKDHTDFYISAGTTYYIYFEYTNGWADMLMPNVISTMALLHGGIKFYASDYSM